MRGDPGIIPQLDLANPRHCRANEFLADEAKTIWDIGAGDGSAFVKMVTKGGALMIVEVADADNIRGRSGYVELYAPVAETIMSDDTYAAARLKANPPDRAGMHRHDFGSDGEYLAYLVHCCVTRPTRQTFDNLLGASIGYGEKAAEDAIAATFRKPEVPA